MRYDEKPCKHVSIGIEGFKYSVIGKIVQLFSKSWDSSIDKLLEDYPLKEE